jgi:hypothetical protein
MTNSAGSREAPEVGPAPSRALPLRLARIAEAICLCGVVFSLAAIIVGTLSVGPSGGTIALCGIAGLVMFCAVPVWIVGTYDGIRAGQHATDADLARWEFGATWGAAAYLAHYLWRWKRRRGKHQVEGAVER